MSGFLRRAGRVLLAVVAAGAVAKFGDNQYYVLLAPLLSGWGKTLRESNPSKWGWLPF